MSNAETKSVDDGTPVRTFAPTKEQLEMLNGQLVAAKFGNMVTVMMQSPQHAGLPLASLQTRVVPPLLLNQFRVAEAHRKGSGNTVPAALILWARVSQEVHDRIAAAPDQVIDLAPKEWNSGENYWIVDAIGMERFLAPLLSDLRAKEFADKTVHFRANGPEGPQIKTLDAAAKPDAPA